jgi:hypothetical protein
VRESGTDKAVRALRECPHLRIEIWGTRFCGSNLDVGHLPDKRLLPSTSSTRGAHTSIRGIALASRDRTECMTHTDTGRVRNSRDDIWDRTSSGGSTRERLESGRT